MMCKLCGKETQNRDIICSEICKQRLLEQERIEQQKLIINCKEGV